MELPIPSHLREYLTPQGSSNTEQEVRGVLRCPCGGETFRAAASNGCRLAVLTCPDCGRALTLFDAEQQGWEGFVCGGRPLDRAAPMEKQVCPRCGADCFRAAVTVKSPGKHDFLELLRHGGTCSRTFDPGEWTDAFGALRADLCCAACGETLEGWLDVQTR